jgi:hypothetical protein
MWVISLLAGASALQVAPCLHPRASILTQRCIRMSDTSSLEPDPNFPSEELSRTWERTGKGKARWKPGDKTGDTALDSRLLWSSWVLNPLELHVRDGLDDESLTCALVLGWLKLPFKVIAYGQTGRPGLARKAGTNIEYRCGDENESGMPLPRLSGKGVPGDTLLGSREVCSFAAGTAKEGRVAPETGRQDLQEWLAMDDEAASVEAFAPLLRGVDTVGIPLLNAWGLSMDDAFALPELVRRIEVSGKQPDDEDVVMYVDGCLSKAGIAELFAPPPADA